MLTITNNQQTPSFQQRAKMGERSNKVVKYLWNKGINPNHLLIGSLVTTGGAAAVSYANPNLIAAPDSAKFGVLGGLAAVIGAMFTSTGKKDSTAGEQLPNAKKTASPLVMMALGSLIGGGALAGLSPIVQHNAKTIAEQTNKIREQRKEIIENSAVLLEIRDYSNKNKGKSNRVYELENEFGKFQLTKKGMKQYKKIVAEYYEAKAEADKLEAIARGEYMGSSLTNYGYTNLSNQRAKCDQCLSDLELLITFGQLP